MNKQHKQWTLALKQQFWVIWSSNEIRGSEELRAISKF